MTLLKICVVVVGLAAFAHAGKTAGGGDESPGPILVSRDAARLAGDKEFASRVTAAVDSGQKGTKGTSVEVLRGLCTEYQKLAREPESNLAKKLINHSLWGLSDKCQNDRIEEEEAKVTLQELATTAAAVSDWFDEHNERMLKRWPWWDKESSDAELGKAAVHSALSIPYALSNVGSNTGPGQEDKWSSVLFFKDSPNGAKHGNKPGAAGGGILIGSAVAPMTTAGLTVKQAATHGTIALRGALDADQTMAEGGKMEYNVPSEKEEVAAAHYLKELTKYVEEAQQ